jgi:hypothetical protein
VSLLQAITLAIAVLGAVLGIVNTWQVFDASRVKLKVLPKHAIPVGGADPSLRFCVAVTNLSAFPLTVNEVGVMFRGTDERGVFVHPVLLDGGPWPRRLESRSTVTVYGARPGPIRGHPIVCAYAETDCGNRKCGTSAALK